MVLEYLPTMNNRVWIFATTLRDGEQSPGCSMNVPEKLRMAGKLVELGVDILEAGFPIASDGDFEAVGAVAREFPWVNVAALARSNKLDVERAAQSLKNAKRPPTSTTKPSNSGPSAYVLFALYSTTANPPSPAQEM